jgi:LmbE family N-acetylglucosaminyl deacetylase
MGGAIQRLAAAGWQWTLVAMCVPDLTRRQYFLQTCLELGASPVTMEFPDYMGGPPFSRNEQKLMRQTLADAVRGQTFELVFTHSRGPNGEYWARHANHEEVRMVTAELVESKRLGDGRGRLAHFAYDVIYGGGTATCAMLNSDYRLPLTYPELLAKCRLSGLAPDADTSLRNLCYPCPNPEAFEGDDLELPNLFVRRR